MKTGQSEIEMHNSKITTELEADGAQAWATHKEEVDSLDLLIAVARRKRRIGTITLASAALAAIISIIIPNRYTASAKILPPQQPQSSAALLMNQLAGSSLGSLAAATGKDLGLKNPNDLYVGILKTRSVEDDLITKFDLIRVYNDKKISEARKDLEHASNIASTKEGLIDISVEDHSPKRAAALANAYVEELRNLTMRLAMTDASQRRMFFEQQLKRAKDDLAEAEVALKNTEQQTGMIQIDAQAKAIIEAVASIRAQIAAKEVQLEGMHSFATNQNPQIILQERQLAGLHQQLATLEKQQTSPAADPIVSTGNVPTATLEYVRRLREVKYRETIYEVMAKQYEAAKLDEAKGASIIQVVDPAIEPDSKSSPRSSLILLLFTTTTFFISVAWALTDDALARVRRNPVRARQLAVIQHHLIGSKS